MFSYTVLWDKCNLPCIPGLSISGGISGIEIQTESMLMEPILAELSPRGEEYRSREEAEYEKQSRAALDVFSPIHILFPSSLPLITIYFAPSLPTLLTLSPDFLHNLPVLESEQGEIDQEWEERRGISEREKARSRVRGRECRRIGEGCREGSEGEERVVPAAAAADCCTSHPGRDSERVGIVTDTLPKGTPSLDLRGPSARHGKRVRRTRGLWAEKTPGCIRTSPAEPVNSLAAATPSQDRLPLMHVGVIPKEHDR